jgi:uncharacterized protein YcbX
MRQLTLSEIWIYPIKSLGGITLHSAKVLEKGLQHDRRWMLIDENSVFMTQRNFTQMALFKLSINGDNLTITYKKNPGSLENPSISLNSNVPPLGQVITATIWDDQVDVVEVDHRISEWFSNHLNIKCKLVSFPETHSRPVDPKYKINGEQVSLADAFPFLIIGQASLELLNSKLKEPIPMNRFRPNFVFAGGVAHEEDNWRNFTIGINRFVGVKPCARCAVPTINQDTAEKGVEPSLTLSTYRRRENKILFGQNAVALDHGQVHVGDTIITKS